MKKRQKTGKLNENRKNRRKIFELIVKHNRLEYFLRIFSIFIMNLPVFALFHRFFSLFSREKDEKPGEKMCNKREEGALYRR